MQRPDSVAHHRDPLLLERRPDGGEITTTAVEIDSVGTVARRSRGEDIDSAAARVGDVARLGRQRRQHRLESLDRPWSAHCSQPDVLRDVAEPQVAALPCHDVVPGRGPCGAIDQQHGAVGKTIDRHPAEYAGIVVQQQRVREPPGRQHREIGGGDPVDEGVGVRPGNLELAEAVGNPDRRIGGEGTVFVAVDHRNSIVMRAF